MNNLYTKITLLFLMSGITLSAQQVSNNNFEDWSGTPFDGVAQPAVWNYCNVTQTVAGIEAKFNFAHKEAGRNGGYCIMVQDQDLKVAGLGETSPGYVTLGHPWVYLKGVEVKKATAGTYGGVEWTYRPDTMAVWIKRTGDNALNEDFHILYYAWTGTAYGDKYKGKDGSCTETSKTDEESDIRQSTDGNECGTTTAANQVAEGWHCQRATYTNWTLIKVPIYYVNNDTPEKMNIIFSASNYPNFRANSGLYAGNSLYIDDVQLIYSSKIHQLFIDGTEWKKFNPNSTATQYYVVDDDVTTIPSIKAFRGAGQLTNSKNVTTSFWGRQLTEKEITIVEGTIDKTPTTITVRAEDGSSTTTYRILFMHKASNNAKLDNIQANGQSIKNFNQNISDYVIEVPYGSTMPVISATIQEEGQTVELTQPTSLEDVTVITVTAPDHTTTKVYTIRYKQAPLSDNTVKGIIVNGTAIANFLPTKTNYVVNLPLGSTTIPTVVVQSNYPDGMQTFVLTPPDTVMEGALYTISVTTPGNATPMVYQLRFHLVQSSNCQLQAIYVNGEPIEGFSPNKKNYQITLTEGATTYPQITFTQGDAYQTVEVHTNPVNSTTRLVVTAINGSKMIYTITYINAPIPDNILKSIYIAEADSTLCLQDTSQHTFGINLPYGVTSCSVSYVKNYTEQTVIVQPGGITEPTIITVYPNSAKGRATVYTIIPKVGSLHPASLTAISVDGVDIPNFNPNQHSYIVNRTTTDEPRIDVQCANGTTVDKTTDLWHSTITVTNNTYTNTYSLFFHYPNDTIPNGEFNYWGTTAVSNTAKPISWNVPGDYVSGSSPQWIGIIYNTSSPEKTVQKENASVVHLNTTYYACLASAFPSVMNLSKMTAELGVAGGSSVSTSGLIPFHNTPDRAIVNYKYPNSAGNGALFQFKFTDLDDISHTGYFTSDQKTAYSDYNLALNTNGHTIHGMDIIVNATNQFSGASSGADLYIDYIRFAYNNTLTGIWVNGKPTTKNGNNFSIVLNSSLDTQEPLLSFAGEVSDQAQSVTWTAAQTEGSYNIRDAAITNYGEDGQFSSYRLTIYRPLDSNTALKALTIGGQPLSNFHPDKLTYTYCLSSDTETIPDIAVELQNHLQTCTVSLENSTATIQVKSENGNIRTYTILFVFSPTLKMISYNHTEVPGYEENLFDYTIQLKQGETMWPAISYIKNDSNQMVDITYTDTLKTVSLLVASPNRLLRNTYTIRFLPYLSDNARLKDLQISNYHLNFYDTIFIYSNIELDSPYLPSITYTPAEPAQTVAIDTTYSFNEDSTHCSITVNINITAENRLSTETYSLQFEYFNPNTYLKNIYINNHPLDTTLGFTHNFDYERLDYYITYPIGTQPNTFIADTAVSVLAHNPHAVVSMSTDTVATISDTAGITIPTQTRIYIVVQADNRNRTYTIHQKLLLDSINRATQLLIANQQGVLENMPNFSPDEYYYVYTLSDTRNSVPDFTLKYSNTSSPFAYVNYDRGNNFRIVEADDNSNYAFDYSENDPCYRIFYMAENGTKYTYKIKFRRSEIKRAQKPMDGDVLVQPIPGTTQIAVASLRANVMFGLYDMAGRMIELHQLPESDPNSLSTTTDGFGQTYFGHLTDFSSCTIITLEPSKLYFWIFTENGKRKIKSGKIMMLP